MENLGALLHGFSVALTPYHLGLMVVGVLLGILVGVLPGLVAPLVLWPAATGGEPEPARLAAGVATLAIGLWTKSVLAAMVAGAAVLYGVLWLTG